jgi:hypothetical protein
MSPEEARLLALERRVYRLPVLDLERRAVALEQGLAQSWSWGVGYQTPTPTPLDPTKAYIVVRCWGENGVPFSGCPVTIKDGGGATVDSGSSGIDGSFHAVALNPATYTVVTSASGKTDFTGSTSFPTGITYVDVLVLATGTTLTMNDAVYGTVALSWDAANHRWEGTHTGRSVAANQYNGFSLCAAASNVSIRYRFVHSMINSINVAFTATGGGCARDASLSSFYVDSNKAANATRGTPNYGTPGFSQVFTTPASGFADGIYYTHGAVTLTVTQP